MRLDYWLIIIILIIHFIGFLSLILAVKWRLGGAGLLTPDTRGSVSWRTDANGPSALSNWKLHLLKMQLPWKQPSSGIFVFWRYGKTQWQCKSTRHDINMCSSVLLLNWSQDGKNMAPQCFHNMCLGTPVNPYCCIWLISLYLPFVPKGYWNSLSSWSCY